ncbi:MAG: hypothetical protein JOY94_08830 [Methylobacteriaceae bacterium]|nr:hypothetical protein [Methylobacteriaceae bacterium]MBV9219507.1 hypothetical protein [Methylobacteriaceae bacterium]MBV9636658.1 hypothetical protein [Methylobacteriaceae bacterium]
MRLLPILSLASAVIAVFASPGRAESTDGVRLSGPFVHANLAVYFVHSRSAEGPVPLTLQEALAKGVVEVRETGSVNELTIENLGKEEVFVQSGDIVKGGQQDRVLTVSLLLSPRSGRISIASFCVEQGRWSARGAEDVTKFASAEATVPSREAKIAMKGPLSGAAGDLPAAATGNRQLRMWENVAQMQNRLAASLSAPVAAPSSLTSLPLALENDKLKSARSDYVAALRAAGEKDDDIVGFVFAVNGKLNSADVYPSNGLFRKMWGKLLDASATEAIADAGGEAKAPPTAAAVTDFLKTAEQGKPSDSKLTKEVSLETRDGDVALYFETRRAGGGFVHRNYLAK